MPTYEFECKSCYNKYEKVNIPISKASKVAKCPKCGKKAIRIFSSVNVIIN